jgi:hypothetical protein
VGDECRSERSNPKPKTKKPSQEQAITDSKMPSREWIPGSFGEKAHSSKRYSSPLKQQQQQRRDASPYNKYHNDNDNDDYNDDYADDRIGVDARDSPGVWNKDRERERGRRQVNASGRFMDTTTNPTHSKFKRSSSSGNVSPATASSKSFRKPGGSSNIKDLRNFVIDSDIYDYGERGTNGSPNDRAEDAVLLGSHAVDNARRPSDTRSSIRSSVRSSIQSSSNSSTGAVYHGQPFNYDAEEYRPEQFPDDDIVGRPLYELRNKRKPTLDTTRSKSPSAHNAGRSKSPTATATRRRDRSPPSQSSNRSPLPQSSGKSTVRSTTPTQTPGSARSKRESVSGAGNTPNSNHNNNSNDYGRKEAWIRQNNVRSHEYDHMRSRLGVGAQASNSPHSQGRQQPRSPDKRPNNIRDSDTAGQVNRFAAGETEPPKGSGKELKSFYVANNQQEQSRREYIDALMAGKKRATSQSPGRSGSRNRGRQQTSNAAGQYLDTDKHRDLLLRDDAAKMNRSIEQDLRDFELKSSTKTRQQNDMNGNSNASASTDNTTQRNGVGGGKKSSPVASPGAGEGGPLRGKRYLDAYGHPLKSHVHSADNDDAALSSIGHSVDSANVSGGHHKHSSPHRSKGHDDVSGAEWGRLLAWLKEKDILRYADNFARGGITKLSVVELLHFEDLRLLGIEPTRDIAKILGFINEFSSRTRSFSQQALDELEFTTGSPSSPHTEKRPGYLSPSTQMKPLNPAAVSSTEVLNSLLKSFDEGDCLTFDRYWDIVYSRLRKTDNKHKLATKVNALQVLYFNIQLHFAVYPIIHKQSLEKISWSMKRLRYSLDDIVANTHKDDMKTAANKALTLTKEFATYAGIVFSPEPQQNILYAPLFKEDGARQLRKKLEFFLQLVGVVPGNDEYYDAADATAVPVLAPASQESSGETTPLSHPITLESDNTANVPEGTPVQSADMLPSGNASRRVSLSPNVKFSMHDILNAAGAAASPEPASSGTGTTPGSATKRRSVLFPPKEPTPVATEQVAESAIQQESADSPCIMGASTGPENSIVDTETPKAAVIVDDAPTTAANEVAENDQPEAEAQVETAAAVQPLAESVQAPCQSLAEENVETVKADTESQASSSRPSVDVAAAVEPVEPDAVATETETSATTEPTAPENLEVTAATTQIQNEDDASVTSAGNNPLHMVTPRESPRADDGSNSQVPSSVAKSGDDFDMDGNGNASSGSGDSGATAAEATAEAAAETVAGAEVETTQTTATAPEAAESSAAAEDDKSKTSTDDAVKEVIITEDAPAASKSPVAVKDVKVAPTTAAASLKAKALASKGKTAATPTTPKSSGAATPTAAAGAKKAPARFGSEKAVGSAAKGAKTPTTPRASDSAAKSSPATTPAAAKEGAAADSKTKSPAKPLSINADIANSSAENVNLDAAETTTSTGAAADVSVPDIVLTRTPTSKSLVKPTTPSSGAGAKSTTSLLAKKAAAADKRKNTPNTATAAATATAVATSPVTPSSRALAMNELAQSPMLSTPTTPSGSTAPAGASAGASAPTSSLSEAAASISVGRLTTPPKSQLQQQVDEYNKMVKRNSIIAEKAAVAAAAAAATPSDELVQSNDNAAAGNETAATVDSNVPASDSS